MFSKKATKIDEIFTVDLTLCSKCQIVGEDFVKFCGLLRKHELYQNPLCKQTAVKGLNLGYLWYKSAALYKENTKSTF